MSVSSAPRQSAQAGPAGYEGYGEEDRGFGWVAFAGVLLIMLGTLNFIEGLAAIGNAHFFVANTHYIAGSWFASESMTQIRVLISPHLRGFRFHQEGVLDDRAGTFCRQRWLPSTEAVPVAFAEV